MKSWMVWMVAGIVAWGNWARGGATVSDVEVRQRYPWNGLVDITCRVTGITGEGDGLKLLAVAAVDGESGTVQPVSHVRVVKDGAETDDLTVEANGSYSLVWDARADLGEGQWSDMVVRVTIDDYALRGGQLWAGGPYWADRNIGAENPWDSGLYFWWGDTTGHRLSGTAFSFSFSPDFDSGISSYGQSMATLRSEGWITAGGGLVSAHDAAHVHWGGAWRMPTDQELQDLSDQCDWTWTAMNGVSGCLVRGRGAYSDNGVFLPAAGYGDRTSPWYTGSRGYYWSSITFSDYDYYCSKYLRFGSGFHTMDYYQRYCGFPVRPVRGADN